MGEVFIPMQGTWYSQLEEEIILSMRKSQFEPKLLLEHGQGTLNSERIIRYH